MESTVSTEAAEIQQLNIIAEHLYAYLGLFIMTSGTVGNLFNFILFSRLESLKTLASSLFLLTSCIASQTVLTSGLLTRIIRGFSGIDPVHTSILFCKIRWTIRTIANAVSLTCICLAAVDRYFLSCQDARRHRWITIKRAYFMILGSILFWTGVFSSYGVFYTAPRPSSCSIADPVFVYFASYFNLIHYSVLPLSVLTFFCLLTWHNLGQQPATFLRGGVRLYDQVTRMLIVQSIAILVTSTPNMVWQIYSVSTQSTRKADLQQARENLFNTFCVLTGFSTHALAFYSYVLGSPTFRKSVRELMFCSRRVSPSEGTGVK